MECVILQHGISRSRGEGYDSDDVASETSSICSEGGMRGYGGRAQTEVLQVSDVTCSMTFSKEVVLSHPKLLCMYICMSVSKIKRK